jgi:hypothetical protein
MDWWKSAVTSWSRVGRLPPADRWLLAQALALLPLTALALRVVGFNRWQTALARLAPVQGGATAGDEADILRRARAATRLVEAAARHGPFRAACLPRSLALWWLLRRRGIDTDLRIGVRKEAGRFEAHAWVELWGLVLNDTTDVRHRFAAFDRAILPVGGALG